MGVKKSNFVADTTVPVNSTFDFVINGQNFKITIENFKTLLGIGNGNPDPNVIFRALDYTILVSDDFVVGTGPIAFTFPPNPTKSVTLKNNGIDPITLNGNGASVEGGLTLATTQSETYLHDPTANNWMKVT